MRFMPIAFATGVLALTAMTTYLVSESSNTEFATETSEELANTRGSRRGTAHRGSGRRAVLAFEMPTLEYQS
ncbi:MAG: hypothetical protein AAF327_19725 [Cyanobacteria bacterium P01_A01_bin.37]